MPAVNLSTAPGRQTTTETPTRYKSETIPTDARLQRAPQVDIAPSMRNAERPASQADEVRKVLGLSDEAMSNLVDLKQAQFAKSEEQNALVAARDSATGNVNKDVYDRSLAYRMVIADGRVNKAVANAAPNILQSVQTYINQGADADPTKGEMPVTMDDVNRHIDDLVKPLMLDEKGQPIDYGDPHANATLYRAINQLRVQALQSAANQIKQQEQDKAMTAISQVAMGDLSQGKTTAIEEAVHKAAALGIDPALAKKSVLHTVLDAAIQGKDESILQKALTSLQGDGKTSTWNAEERGVLLTNYTTLHNQFEAERLRDAERKSAENMGNLLPDIMSGKSRMTPDTIRALIAKGPANGGITAQDAEHLMSLQNTVDSKKMQQVQFAWSQQQHAWALQEHAYALAQRRASEQMVAVQARFFSGQMTQPQAIASVDQLYRTGQMNNKAYVAARQFLMAMPSPSKLVAQHDGEQFEFSLRDELHRIDQAVAKRTRGYWSPEQWGSVRNNASATFYRQLYATGDPGESLRAALRVAGLKDKWTDSVVQNAHAKTPKLTPFQKSQMTLMSMGALPGAIPQQ